MQREINGEKYNFGMTRGGIRAAERAGLNASTLGDKPMEALYLLWYASLYNSHPMVVKKADNLLDAYLDEDSCPETIEDIMGVLTEEYLAVFKLATE